ncbi:MAG: ABC transporter substrate-binding protein, partial [Pseudomonadota bacterium]
MITGALDAVKTGLSGQREALEADEAKLVEFVDSLLAPRFDRNYAGRLVLARHWRGASKDQKRRFIDGFYQAMLKRYATGVLEFQEDRIEILPSRGEQKGNRATVRTNVTLDSGESVPVNYGLVNRGDAGWKVYDVTIEG